MKELPSILGLKAEPVASGLRQPVAPPTPSAQDVADAFAEAVARAGAARRRLPVLKAGFGAAFVLAACATANILTEAPAPALLTPVLTPVQRAAVFQLEPPLADALGPDLRLWATHYHTPSVTPAAPTISAAFPLIGRDAKAISAPLTHRDWCEAALQGSVSVQGSGSSTAYVFVDANGPEQANCDQWLGSLSDGVKNATRRARFMKVNHPLGCGVRNHPLAPFRTIAVDPDVIPLDSVVFVPELRGRAFTLDGNDYTHDGYLFAGDRGGAIKGRHIDVFLVEKAAGPLEDLFASHDGRTFAAHVMSEDSPQTAAVRESQSANCGSAP